MQLKWLNICITDLELLMNYCISSYINNIISITARLYRVKNQVLKRKHIKEYIIFTYEIIRQQVLRAYN